MTTRGRAERRGDIDVGGYPLLLRRVDVRGEVAGSSKPSVSRIMVFKLLAETPSQRSVSEALTIKVRP